MKYHKNKPERKESPSPGKKAFSESKTPVSVPPPSYRKANRYFALIFFILAFVLYGNTILNKWAVDDEYVTHNDLVRQGFKAIPTILTTPYLIQQGNIASRSADYRPIVKITFAIEYQLLGEKPGASHWINVLIYFALSWLLFTVLRRLFRNYNILFPFLVTVIFMSHPIHTEVVNNLKNLDELLAFLFGLVGLHFFLRWADRHKIRYFILGLCSFFLGYFSKTSVIPFLFIYVLTLYFFTDIKPSRLGLVFGVVLLVGLVAHFLPKLFLPGASRMFSYIENPLYFEKDLWLRIGTGFYTILYYIRLLVYPYPLVYYYGYNMVPVTNLANIWVVISIIICIGILLYSLVKFREKHTLSYAILFYFLAIGMYSNFFIPVVGIVAERFVFVASVSFCIILVWVIFTILKTDPKNLTIEIEARIKIFGLIFLVLIPYGFLIITRNPDWRNLLDLYKTDIRKQEHSAKDNLQFGGYLMKMVYQDENFLRYGEVNQFLLMTMISHFRQALKIYPKNYQTLNDLGTVYLYMAKKYDSAQIFLEKAIALDPKLQPSWVNLGMTYRQMVKYKQAIECYNTILKNNPDQLKAVFALADVYNDMGDFNRAVNMMQEVSKKYPDLDMPYVNTGNYYMARGDTLYAVVFWEMAAQKNPTQEICLQLNYLYRLRGDSERAEYFYRLSQNAVKK